MAEILASLDDINAELPSDEKVPVVVADDDNTALIQIAVARIVKGYLGRVIDNSVIAVWQTPETTPELVSTIAGKLIASQLYFNKTAEKTTDIADEHFAQRKYNEAMKMLQEIIDGLLVLDIGVVVDDAQQLTSADFFPVDDTDRAFTMGQQF